MIKKRRSIILILLGVLAFASCKKKKFLKFDNIIEISIPEECNQCAVYIGKHDRGNNDIETEELESNLGDYHTFIDGISGPQQYDLRIDWDDYISYVDPTEKLRFLLIDQGGNPSDPGFSAGGRKIIMQSVKNLKPRGWYFWEIDDTFGEGTRFNEYDKKVPKPDNNSSSNNPLSGKWNQVGACSNLSGQRNYFNFSSSSSGEIGQIDCADACAGGGTFTQFDYSISGNNVTITPKSVSDYCGVSPTLASPFTVPFSISGNILTLDGQDFEK